MNNEQMAKVVAQILIDAGIAPDPEDMIDLVTSVVPLITYLKVCGSIEQNWDCDIEVSLKARQNISDELCVAHCALTQFNRDCIELLDQAHRELYAERGE